MNSVISTELVQNNNSELISIVDFLDGFAIVQAFNISIYKVNQATKTPKLVKSHDSNFQIKQAFSSSNNQILFLISVEKSVEFIDKNQKLTQFFFKDKNKLKNLNNISLSTFSKFIYKFKKDKNNFISILLVNNNVNCDINIKINYKIDNTFIEPIWILKSNNELSIGVINHDTIPKFILLQLKHMTVVEKLSYTINDKLVTSQLFLSSSKVLIGSQKIYILDLNSLKLKSYTLPGQGFLISKMAKLDENIILIATESGDLIKMTYYDHDIVNFKLIGTIIPSNLIYSNLQLNLILVGNRFSKIFVLDYKNQQINGFVDSKYFKKSCNVLQNNLCYAMINSSFEPILGYTDLFSSAVTKSSSNFNLKSWEWPKHSEFLGMVHNNVVCVRDVQGNDHLYEFGDYKLIYLISIPNNEKDHLIEISPSLAIKKSGVYKVNYNKAHLNLIKVIDYESKGCNLLNDSAILTSLRNDSILLVYKEVNDFRTFTLSLTDYPVLFTKILEANPNFLQFMTICRNIICKYTFDIRNKSIEKNFSCVTKNLGYPLDIIPIFDSTDDYLLSTIEHGVQLISPLNQSNLILGFNIKTKLDAIQLCPWDIEKGEVLSLHPKSFQYCKIGRNSYQLKMDINDIISKLSLISDDNQNPKILINGSKKLYKLEKLKAKEFNIFNPLKFPILNIKSLKGFLENFIVVSTSRSIHILNNDSLRELDSIKFENIIQVEIDNIVEVQKGWKPNSHLISQELLAVVSYSSDWSNCKIEWFKITNELKFKRCYIVSVESRSSSNRVFLNPGFFYSNGRIITYYQKCIGKKNVGLDRQCEIELEDYVEFTKYEKVMGVDYPICKDLMNFKLTNNESIIYYISDNNVLVRSTLDKYDMKVLATKNNVSRIFKLNDFSFFQLHDGSLQLRIVGENFDIILEDFKIINFEFDIKENDILNITVLKQKFIERYDESDDHKNVIKFNKGEFGLIFMNNFCTFKIAMNRTFSYDTVTRMEYIPEE